MPGFKVEFRTVSGPLAVDHPDFDSLESAFTWVRSQLPHLPAEVYAAHIKWDGQLNDWLATVYRNGDTLTMADVVAKILRDPR
ncbi:hypothetical protein GCM10012275_56180 [Longimycelium tulufanense]|uniref:Uncharacterized protein n=1 Tax=Longimycelium tulufanense TaxID=907463 RepID=A0A8J3FY15_9PSEU|nr:hypothetical protein [Longimycelium tulufanense]GGM78302.1 hypothetical protein GCM10012275_56180 [Longimycelium tulufanense]